MGISMFDVTFNGKALNAKAGAFPDGVRNALLSGFAMWTGAVVSESPFLFDAGGPYVSA